MARIIPLSEGSFTVDATKEFIPFDQEADDLHERNRGSLLVEVQPFVLVTDRDYILLDTGLGFTGRQGELWLHRNLTDHGINPSDITLVLISHLHKDHTGGITRDDHKGGRSLSFPQATYYVNKEELAFGLAHDGTSYEAADFKLLQNSEQAVLTGSEGDIDGYIHYQVTGGHSPHHQVFWIRDAEGICFFGGDVAPQASQMKNRFRAKYDYDGKKSMELRQQFLEQGTREGWTFLFYHDIKTPFTKFNP
jgi:glyoxylase-like metal-dependent hydrolase (beta-lactamase superfamily II)